MSEREVLFQRGWSWRDEPWVSREEGSAGRDAFEAQASPHPLLLAVGPGSLLQFRRADDGTVAVLIRHLTGELLLVVGSEAREVLAKYLA